MFNYTNVEAFLDGTDKKLKVEDVGPYTYKEYRYKEGFKYWDDKITYQVSFKRS